MEGPQFFAIVRSTVILRANSTTLRTSPQLTPATSHIICNIHEETRRVTEWTIMCDEKHSLCLVAVFLGGYTGTSNFSRSVSAAPVQIPQFHESSSQAIYGTAPYHSRESPSQPPGPHHAGSSHTSGKLFFKYSLLFYSFHFVYVFYQ